MSQQKMQTTSLTYSRLWDMLKEGKNLKLQVSKFHTETIKRMVSKHKDEDLAYKMTNLTRARLKFTITSVEGSNELVEMKITLNQHPTNWTILLET